MRKIYKTEYGNIISSPKTRAALFVKQLLNCRYDWLSSRGPDKCFENGDGEEVSKIIIQLLNQKGYTKIQHFSDMQQYYISRNWFPVEVQ